MKNNQHNEMDVFENAAMKVKKHNGMDDFGIVALKKMSVDERCEVKKEYDAFGKEHWLFQTHTIYIIWAFSFLVLFLLPTSWQQVFFIISLLCPLEIIKREWDFKSYMEGYEEGKCTGIDKALGISKDESIDIARRVSDNEID